ncbi:hypothetical protein A6R68_10119 [Neotoma lepida]|uniref:Uteroglobin n=1 Tax=Neotoma lepida TaxID=56216 RepID=A0A1A6FXZ2_NEOLE|nr:hypothetical protein A6R68_10119 [Neotoma lepida]
MKIAITITLVMLSICCSSESTYEAALKFYNPGSDLQNAGVQLKKLVDTLPEKTRINILKLSVCNICHSCGF